MALGRTESSRVRSGARAAAKGCCGMGRVSMRVSRSVELSMFLFREIGYRGDVLVAIPRWARLRSLSSKASMIWVVVGCAVAR